MISKAEIYPKIIQKSTIRSILIPEINKQGKPPILMSQSHLMLPSQYSYRSNQQINNNVLNQHIAHQTLKQFPQNNSSSIINQWPLSCIGLVLCQYHYDNQSYYLYGTGTLISDNIVLTSAKNVYSRRLNLEYLNIKFITGLNGNKCSGIYNVMRVNYPKEYTKQQGYENYDFSVLELYHDLSDICGYVGWKSEYVREIKQIISYSYISDKEQGYFNLHQIVLCKNLKQHDQVIYLDIGLLKEGNEYYITGINMSQKRRYSLLNEQMRNSVNQWIKFTKFIIKQQLKDRCDQIVKNVTSDLRQLYSYWVNIGAQGCKYLCQSNWRYLTTLNLYGNSISDQGCKYMSQSNWIHLTTINFTYNKIGREGCRFLCQANWKHLITIYLVNNNIDVEGCKYLRQVNWIHLNTIDLRFNKIVNAIDQLLLKELWPKVLL